MTTEAPCMEWHTGDDDNRLDDTDRQAIAGRLAEVVATWTRESVSGRPPDDPSSVDALLRIGAHAIGCSLYDLRDSELDEIECRALDAIKEATR